MWFSDRTQGLRFQQNRVVLKSINKRRSIGIDSIQNTIPNRWTCWDVFYDFSQQASSFLRSAAVCSAIFSRDLLLRLLNLYHVISAVIALQAAAQV